ncbi:MAG: VTT domain-containing protein [Treponema sp.]|nr:VTT domain-containing protein [Treponema sp.]
MFLLIFFVFFTVILCVFFWPFFRKLREEEYRQWFSGWITKLGIKGVLILLGMQMLQIVVAVIPGGPVELLAGAAYGCPGGLAICLTGCAAATTLIFFLVKKFGSPFVDLFFSRKKIKKYAFLKDTRRLSLVVFVLFLIPGTPKDILTYVFSLSDIGFARFVLISCLARTPAIFSSTLMGASVIEGRWRLLLLIFLLIAATGLLGLLFGGRIIAFFRDKKQTQKEEA